MKYKKMPNTIVPIAIKYFLPDRVTTTHPARIGPGTVQAAI